MGFQSSGDELTPERALEQLGQATSKEDVLHVLHNVILHFIQAVLKAKADDETKAKAVFYLGLIEDSFLVLNSAFYTITKFRFHGFTEERLRNFMITHIAALIRMYAEVKYGNPLEDVVDGLEYVATIMRALIDEYNMFVGSKIDELLNELESITAKE